MKINVMTAIAASSKSFANAAELSSAISHLDDYDEGIIIGASAVKKALSILGLPNTGVTHIDTEAADYFGFSRDGGGITINTLTRVISIVFNASSFRGKPFIVVDASASKLTGAPSKGFDAYDEVVAHVTKLLARSQTITVSSTNNLFALGLLVNFGQTVNPGAIGLGSLEGKLKPVRVRDSIIAFEHINGKAVRTFALRGDGTAMLVSGGRLVEGDADKVFKKFISGK